MSAIVGMIRRNQEKVPNEQCHAMMEAISIYPADETRLWMKQHVFFGCRSQWITPQSVREVLPRYSSLHRLAIVSDAIIDNRSELLELLDMDRQEHCHISDSELILRCYLKWGEDTPSKLIGDFAFMIWDERENRLFGARDFSGARSLYYAHRDDFFAFSTTIRPLLKLQGVGKALNEQWIAEFLAIYTTTETIDPHATIYSDVHQIPPAHYVIVQDGHLRFSRYCKLEAKNKLKLNSDRAYEEAMREVYETAIKARLRTHRQIGANLSGGLDSGSVASFAANMLSEEGKQLHTFSYVPVEGFDGRPRQGRFADERPYIESTVAHVGNINPHYLSFPERNPWTDIDAWLDVYEMPYKFYENSFWVRGIYEEAAKHDAGVLLTGQRGNWSVSWGPAIDFYGLLMRRLRWMKLIREVNQYCQHMQTGRKRLYARIIRKAFPLVRYFERLESPAIPTLIAPEFARRTGVHERLYEHGYNKVNFEYISAYDVREFQFKDPNIWNLTGTVNSKLSLHHRVWGRDPTNDLRVIQFCLSVPDEQFVKYGIDRSLIRRITKGYLPDKVRMNMKTRGVQGADGVYRMASSWQAFIAEARKMTQDPYMQEHVNTQELEHAITRYETGAQEQYVFEFPFRMLMRAMIFYRFIQKHAHSF